MAEAPFEHEAVTVGSRAPDFALPGAAGELRSLRDLIRSGPALLVFFKTTCKSSQICISLYGELERRYGDVVPVVAIAQDPFEPARAWLDDRFFAGQLLTDFPAYQASSAYGLEGLPSGLLVASNGDVVEALVGWSRDALNALAARLGRITARDERAVSTPDDGRIAFRPG
ncbi:MAG: redoxin domain-containing protein [Actinomycetota bacterium]|nr:redoxin domain-containing protein [Actinomycetota bacterium]